MTEPLPPSPDIKPLPPQQVDSNLEGYLRVSQVLDFFMEPSLVDWMVRKGSDAKKLSRQAKKIGSEVDEAIKLFITSGKFGKVKTAEAKSCLEGFKRWHEDYKPVLTVGKRLFNEEFKVTGEPDLYCNSRIIDVKCASSIRPKYHVQTGAYSFLDNKYATGILRLHKHLSDYEYVERNNEEVIDDQTTFFAMLKVYQYLNKPLLGAGESHADSPTDRTF